MAASAGSIKRHAIGLGRVLLAAAAATVLLLALAPFAQARYVNAGFGSQRVYGAAGEPGGTFFSARGVAVNSSGAGAPAGTAYVVDSTNRIQRFGPSGAFDLTWGQDVIAASVNEQQTLDVKGEGTFTLTFKGETTEPIPGFPSGAGCGSRDEIQSALRELPVVGGAENLSLGQIGCTSEGENEFTVTFTGALAGADQPLLTADASNLTGPGAGVHIAPITDGTAATGDTGTGFEICTVGNNCKEGEASGTTANGGQLSEPQGVAVNQANGDVYVTENGNRRVSEFTANGNFVRAWGWDVITSGEPNDTGTGFEICDAASECQQGQFGANGGQFGASLGYPTVDVSNDVWVPEPENRRIQEFDSTGHFIAAYGYNVDSLGGSSVLESCTSLVAGACQAGVSGSASGQFAEGSPSRMAVDSSGDVYAIDSGNNRVQKFDSAFTSASDFGDSTFPSYTSEAPQNVVVSGAGRLAFSINRNLGGDERQIIELETSDESVADTSMVGFGIQRASGLAADSSGEKLYVSMGEFSQSPKEVLVLGSTPLPAPESILKPIEAGGKTTTLEGKVDPKGGIGITCKFQYSLDQASWTDVPTGACGNLSPHGGKQAIMQTLTGLDPNAEYFVRLIVTRRFEPSATSTSSIQVFRTASVPPATSAVGAVDVSDTSARLAGTIDPKNSNTAYVFEYGTTVALGSSTGPLAVGGGVTPITVSQQIGGLTPNTTYFVRLSATNAFGTTKSEEATFTTRSTPLPLPEHRAWEMVTPQDKNYTDPNHGILTPDHMGISTTGDAIGFCSSALFGEPAGQIYSFCAPYVTRRTSAGWKTSNPFPPTCRYAPGDLNPDESLYGEGGERVYPSADYSRFVVKITESESCSIPPLDPAAPLVHGSVSSNLYRQSQEATPFSYDLLNPRSGAERSDEAQNFIGGSESFSHVVFTSQENNQTDPPDSPPPGNFRKIYQWEEEGQDGCGESRGCVTLVSKDTDNVPFSSPSSPPANIDGLLHFPGMISRDGSRIFFQNPTTGGGGVDSACTNPGCELYMRAESSTTYDVSASECTAPNDCGEPASKADAFVAATPSGEVALFGSCARLTDESNSEGPCTSPVFTVAAGVKAENGSKLYRWDLNSAPGHRLIDLTADHEPSDGSQPQFRGLVGMSEDGDTIYFVTEGQIMAGKPTSAVEKLYRWRWNEGSPEVDYLGPYQTIGIFGHAQDWNVTHHQQTVTPDGKYILIYSALRLNPAADSDSDIDAYRWNESDSWVCVSCQDPAAPSTGDVSLDFRLQLEKEPFAVMASDESSVFMTDDGQHIFFATPDALVPQDVNGQASCEPVVINGSTGQSVPSCQDIYEWHDGTVDLISSGTGNEPARLISATHDGRDVFFLTRQRLVGWDLDLNNDVYDARIGGGFPEPAAQPTACEGESCRGAGTKPTASAGAGTAVFQGPGNPQPAAGCPKGKIRKSGKCVSAREHRPHRHKHRRRAAKAKRRAGR
jgi:hypothetical protein